MNITTILMIIYGLIDILIIYLSELIKINNFNTYIIINFINLIVSFTLFKLKNKCIYLRNINNFTLILIILYIINFLILYNILLKK